MKIHIKNVLTLLPEGNGYRCEKTDIFLKDDLIDSIGTGKNDFRPDKVIDGESMLAIPGLINCHTHAYMSVFRNLADDLPFDQWLFKTVMPLEDKMDGNDAYWSTLLGYAEMIKTGTVACMDMHMFRGDVARAADDIGIRAVLTRGLVGFGRDDLTGKERINDLTADIAAYKNNDRITFMVAPHAVYTTDKEYLELCAETAKKYSIPIHIHLSETKIEVDTAYEKYGKSPVAYLNDIGIFDAGTVAAHCVYLSDDDIGIMADKKVSVAANPKSNLKLANGIAPIDKLHKAGVNVCIGTDSAASNNSLNLFSDMNYTALLHKGVSKDPTVTDGVSVLNFATRQGAKALRLNSGVLEVGRKADIVLLETNNPQFTPKGNYPAALVYSANGTEVNTVIINGEIVLKDKRLTKLDEEEIYSKANEVLKNLLNK